MSARWALYTTPPWTLPDRLPQPEPQPAKSVGCGSAMAAGLLLFGLFCSVGGRVLQSEDTGGDLDLAKTTSARRPSRPSPTLSGKADGASPRPN